MTFSQKESAPDARSEDVQDHVDTSAHQPYRSIAPIEIVANPALGQRNLNSSDFYLSLAHGEKSRNR
jgi:hypothetical protein